MTLPARVLAALTAVATGGALLFGAAVPAHADEGTPAEVSLRPVAAAGTTVSGPFAVTADVSMNSSTRVSVTASVLISADLWSKLTSLGVKTVTAQDCPQTCVLTWSFDPTAKEAAWPSGSVRVMASVQDGSNPAMSIPAGSSTYISPVADFVGQGPYERPVSDTTRDYQPTVLDTGGVVRVSSTQPRSPGETLHASIRTTGAAATELATAAGTWGSPDPATGTIPGRVSLDTTSTAEGNYSLYVQARTASGQWGPARYVGPLTVRHRPVADWWPVAPMLAGSEARLWVTLSPPWSTGRAPASIEVGVDGATPAVIPARFDGDSYGPWYASVTVPAERLPLGTRTATARILDQEGQQIGAVSSIKIPVVTFTETVTTPALVVGEQVPVTIKGTAPAGLTYSFCDFAFYDRAGLNNTADGTVCWYQKSFTRITHPIPRIAGAARFELQPEVTTGLTMRRTFPVTVYAARSATLTAPTSAAYGAKVSATIKVTDLADATKPATGRSAVAVTLQRKAAGSTSWSSLGTARTDAYGKAVISFASTASGRLRAVVPSSVPGRTVATAERSVTSVSTVSWSSLPTAATSGALVYAKVYARPYEKGASVRVQARLKGSSTWRTVGSARVSSTGQAKPTMRLYTRRTWEVRVVRVATTQRATGYSSVKRISVR